jgi:peroxiredoxin
MLNKSAYNMKKTILTSALALLFVMLANAGLKPGDKAVGFTLKNVDGTSVSLSDYSDQKGVIVVFTCNPCPYANAYEQRIIALHNKFEGMGFPVVAIDPNDDELSPEDTFEKMKEKAEAKEYPFPYLKDETQEVYKTYGATNTPHVYVLKNNGGTFKVAYVGAIDDNAMDESSVTRKYVENAVSSILSGSSPDPTSTKAIGCAIKTKS